MKIIVQNNKARGIGYEVAFVEGPIMKLYRDDQRLMELSEACQFARYLLEEHNRRFGTSYKPEECIAIDEEALEANSRRDINAARAWQEIQTGKFRDVSYSPVGADEIFHSQVDVTRHGKDEKGAEKISIKITNEGLFLAVVKGVLFGEGGGLEDKQVSGLIDAFCRHLAAHGYGKGAKEIRKEMVSMGEDRCTVWTHDMIRRYRIGDDDFNRFAWEAGFR